MAEWMELRGQDHQFVWRAKWSVTTGCFRTMTIQDHGQRHAGPHVLYCGYFALKERHLFLCIEWLEQTHTVQSPTAEVNLASIEPKQRHGKRLQIQRQIPRNYSQGKEESNWGQKEGLGYSKIDMGRHSDLRSRNSTFKCRSRQAGPYNSATRVILFYLNSIQVDANLQALNVC